MQAYEYLYRSEVHRTLSPHLLHNPEASKEVTPQRVDQESACDLQTASKDMEPCTSASLITCNNLSLEEVYLCVVSVKV